MSRRATARRTLLAPVLAAVLVLVPAGTASASPRSAQAPPRPAALPSLADLLRGTGLVDVLSQLLQVPTQPSVGSLPGPVVSKVAASTVKVSSVACGSRVEGSGFSPAADTVVTNAHVVAGSTRTEVLRPDGRRLPAEVQVFDPARDLAVLSVPNLGEQPLGLGSAVTGGSGAVFGHPQGQAPIEVSPALVVRRVAATTSDIYGQGRYSRQILVLASRLEPGDSGGPLVNQAGEVVGVAFAVSAVRATTAFAIPSETVAPVLAQPRTGAVSTGACLG
jgi:S1-C subfamily serine protease